MTGIYKGKGYAKALLKTAVDDAKSQGTNGLVTVIGTKKYHFTSNTEWFPRQGLETVEKLSNGFSLLALKIAPYCSFF